MFSIHLYLHWKYCHIKWDLLGTLYINDLLISYCIIWQLHPENYVSVFFIEAITILIIILGWCGRWLMMAVIFSNAKSSWWDENVNTIIVATLGPTMLRWRCLDNYNLGALPVRLWLALMGRSLLIPMKPSVCFPAFRAALCPGSTHIHTFTFTSEDTTLKLW